MLNLDTKPYYDDYQELKDFTRILFRPGYAIQARELTQLQTMLQKQIERNADFVVKHGSIVSGGQTAYDATYSYCRLDPNNSTDLTSYLADIALYKLVGAKVQNSAGTAIGIVINYSSVTTEDPPTLFVKYITNNTFVANEVLTIKDVGIVTPGLDLTVQVENTVTAVGSGSAVIIQPGVFYIKSKNDDLDTTSSFFLYCAQQTVILDKYTNSPSYKIGLVVTEQLVTAEDDSTLLDPAQGSYNYLAPGADRYKVTLVLSKKDLTAEDTDDFVELMRVESGVLTNHVVDSTLGNLEKTLAQRTYDESGNYAVKPWELNVEDSQTDLDKVSLVLEPGKGYIGGYGFETQSPSIIDIARARTYADVATGFDMFSNYGNYCLVTGLTGAFEVVGQEQVKLYSDTGAIQQIGTARVRQIKYSSGTVGSSTEIYKVYLYDVNTTSPSDLSFYTTTKSVSFFYSSVTPTYTEPPGGARFTPRPGIRSNTGIIFDNFPLGVNQPLTSITPTIYLKNTAGTWVEVTGGVAPTIQSWSLTTGTTIYASYDNCLIRWSRNNLTGLTGMSLEISYDWYVTNILGASSSSSYISPPAFYTEVKFDLYGSGGSSASTSSSSTELSRFSNVRRIDGVQSSAYALISATGIVGGNAQLYDTTNNMAIFIPPNQTIKTFRDSTGAAITEYAAQKKFSVSFNGSGVASISTGSINATFYGGAGTLSADVIKENYMLVTSDTIVRLMDSIIVGSGGYSATINCVAAASLTGTLIAKVNLNSVPEKTKSLTSTTLTITAPISVYALGISDVYNITIQETDSLGSDITSFYTFDNGQTDNYYGWATITPIPGFAPTTGNIYITINYFTHSGNGYFSVDSYLGSGLADEYTDIPTYVSPATGLRIELRDVLDFRPRLPDVASGGLITSNLTGGEIPVPNDNIGVAYSYYLPRRDLVVATDSKSFKVIGGTPALAPILPSPENITDMVLYDLFLPAYTFDAGDVEIVRYENKRYTMKDIGIIDNRVKKLEYYTSLSLIEKETKSLTIPDVYGNDRVKAGMVIDSFRGHSIGDITNSDHICSIDFTNQVLRPAYEETITPLSVDADDAGTTAQKTGELLTVPYTSIEYQKQDKASKSEPINPFGISNWFGYVKITPYNEPWFDEYSRPYIISDITGENDNWKYGSRFYGSEWNAWETRSTGKKLRAVQLIDNDAGDFTLGDSTISNNTSGNRLNASSQISTGSQLRNTQLVDENTTRDDLRNGMSFESNTRVIGDKKVDTSIRPYTKSVDFLYFNAGGLKPLTELFTYMDNKQFITQFSRPVTMDQYTGGIVSALTNSTNAWRAFNTTNVDENDCWLATSSGSTGTITYDFGANNGKVLDHYTITTANRTNHLAPASWTLQGSNDNSSWTTIDTVTSGSYTAWTSKNETKLFNILVVPASYRYIRMVITATTIIGSGYNYLAVGELGLYSEGIFTNEVGACYGYVTISPGEFLMGSRLFRLSDASTYNTISSSKTLAETIYYADGMIDSTNNGWLTSTRPFWNSGKVSIVADFNVAGQAASVSNSYGYDNPFAQTFFVDSIKSPNGIFLSSVNLYFASKSVTNSPIRLQIHPVVNGIPDNNKVVPFSEIVLPASLVNISTDATTATTFTFNSPIHLKPGEWSLVLITSDPNYKVYLAENGTNQIGTTKRISQSSVLGTLYKYQSAANWTSEKNQTLTYKLNRCQFNTNTQYFAILKNTEIPSYLNKTLSTFYYDVFKVYAPTLVFPGNALNWQVKKTNSGSSLDTSWLTIPANENILSNTRLQLAASGQIKVRPILETTDDYTSPVIDLEQLNAILVYNDINNDSSGENNSTSGAASSKYVSRIATLYDGFDATGLQVFLTVKKPSEATVKVYYKVMTAEENGKVNFDNKPYVEMENITNTTLLANQGINWVDYAFDIVGGQTGALLTPFKYFAVKVVLLSSNPAKVPMVKDLRIIALV